MDRRRFVGGVAVGVIVSQFAAHAQQAAKVPRLGFLVQPPLESSEMRALLDAFRKGLRDHGYVEDRTSSSSTDPRTGGLSNSSAWRANWSA